MPNIWMSHVKHMNESCHTFTHMDESCHTYGWVMAHIWMSHGTHMDESCQFKTCDETRVEFKRVTRLIHMCCMTHLYVHHKLLFVTWLLQFFDWPRACVTCHIWMSHINESRHSHVTYVNEPCHIRMRHVKYEWDEWTSPHISHVKKTNQPCYTYECVTKHRPWLTCHSSRNPKL